MTDEDAETRKKRLRIRAWRRGIKEMDLVIGGFVDAEIDALLPAELDLLEDIMGESDLDLLSWVTGQKPTPEPYRALLERMAPYALPS